MIGKLIRRHLVVDPVVGHRNVRADLGPVDDVSGDKLKKKKFFLIRQFSLKRVYTTRLRARSPHCVVFSSYLP